MSTVIRIENLYKEYRLGVIGHGTLYRDLQSWWATVRGKEDPNTLIGHTVNGKARDKILALNDISMEVKDGEVLGIIGANGAGKSTLLKIMSRVTAPTKGRIKVRGRIASLLEVGTGFHPELTGRENIYLNGTINGMNSAEVTLKLDEIVDFAGVELFLDTPIKRYSTGMLVRLGFAVAAHLDPDILVVDEVLAVGDASFQKKAIGKMQDVSKGEGRTVLFVSHNMQSVRTLCHKAILLDKGSLIFQGKTNEVVNRYIQGVSSTSVRELLLLDTFKRDKPVDGSVEFTDFIILNKHGETRQHFNEGEKACFHFGIKVYRDINYLEVEVGLLSNKLGELLVFIKKCVSDKPLIAGYENKFILELETSSIAFGEFPMYVLLKGKGMYEDYDFLSKFNLPPLHIINNNYVGMSAVDSLFHVKSNLKMVKDT